MLEIKQGRGHAEAAEQRADEKVLSKFEHGDGAIDERDGEAENGGEDAAPFELAFLQLIEFVHKRQRALNLARRGERGVSRRPTAVMMRSNGGAAGER